ncbi:MAG: substrate-binding domain-containing protein [Bacteroidia bacterium]|nr:substrate-binding domain-containing protein [Bacteroidia bacterium]
MKNLFFIFVILSLIISCDNAPNKEDDTPVSGTINISVDESYQPFISQEVNVFTSIYYEANINLNYVDENTAISNLLSNTVRLIVINRELTGEESDVLKQYGIIPRVTKIAIDAVALIVNNDNPDSMFTIEALKKIITGETRIWKQVSGKPMVDSLIVVFDNSNSSNARILKEKFLGTVAFPKNIFAVKSNKEVIDYVSMHKSALGAIGINWLSDWSDSLTNSFLNKVRVVSLSPSDSLLTDKEYYKPYQAYIALKKYPLLRDVYIISREMKAGLGTGFASFVAGDNGQRIVRRAGLLPATMPVRLIKVN